MKPLREKTLRYFVLLGSLMLGICFALVIVMALLTFSSFQQLVWNKMYYILFWCVVGVSIYFIAIGLLGRLFLPKNLKAAKKKS